MHTAPVPGTTESGFSLLELQQIVRDQLTPVRGNLRSTAVGNLAKALAAAQGKIRTVIKDKTAKIESQKGAYSYNYADLASVIEACRDPLSANGLSYSQFATREPEGVRITTILMHESGELLQTEIVMTCPSHRPQDLGSAITYARRYSLAALVGVASEEEDDDAGAAQAASRKAEKSGGDTKPAPPAKANQPRSPEEYDALVKLGKVKFSAEKDVKAALDGWLKSNGTSLGQAVAMDQGQLQALVVKLQGWAPPDYANLRAAFFAGANSLGLPVEAAYHWAGRSFGFPWDEGKERYSLSAAPLPNVQACVRALQALNSQDVARIHSDWLQACPKVVS